MRYTREQKRAKLLAAAEAVIEEFLDWEEQAGAPTLSEIEEEVLKVRPVLSRRMLEVALADQEAAQLVEEPECSTCGGRMRYKGQKELVVESRAGTVSVVRGHYYCARCGSGHFPPGPTA